MGFGRPVRQHVRKRRIHGVSCEEAAGLFTSGAGYCEMFDEDHLISEDRFICIGPIRRRVVVVVKTEPDDDVLRIISARRAPRRELRFFQRYLEAQHS